MQQKPYRFFLKQRFAGFLDKRYFLSKIIMLAILGLVCGLIYEIPIIIGLLLGWLAAHIAPVILNLIYVNNQVKYTASLPLLNFVNGSPKLYFKKYHYTTRLAYAITYIGHSFSLIYEPLFILGHYVISGLLAPYFIAVSALQYFEQNECQLNPFSKTPDLSEVSKKRIEKIAAKRRSTSQTLQLTLVYQEKEMNKELKLNASKQHTEKKSSPH